jgi:hypothetical protein
MFTRNFAYLASAVRPDAFARLYPVFVYLHGTRERTAFVEAFLS